MPHKKNKNQSVPEDSQDIPSEQPQRNPDLRTPLVCWLLLQDSDIHLFPSHQVPAVFAALLHDAVQVFTFQPEVLLETRCPHEVVCLLYIQVLALDLTNHIVHLNGHLRSFWYGRPSTRQSQLLKFVSIKFCQEVHETIGARGGLGNVTLELLSQLLSNLMLLTLDEGLEHNPNCIVQVLANDMLPQFHACVRLCEPDDAVNVPRRHRCTSTAEGLCADVLVEVCKLLPIDIPHFRVHPLPSIDNVLLQEVLWNRLNACGLLLLLQPWLHRLVIAVGLWMRPYVAAHDVVCKSLVLHCIGLVSKHAQQIETAENWV
mmetsp:Transcript_68048/g.131390  ORF Transcript_68048/g.131390 Transcript_68048/m.131390 type:complete len:316 (-) Transcript_68048:552-1499(-)